MGSTTASQALCFNHDKATANPARGGSAKGSGRAWEDFSSSRLQVGSRMILRQLQLLHPRETYSDDSRDVGSGRLPSRWIAQVAAKLTIPEQNARYRCLTRLTRFAGDVSCVDGRTGGGDPAMACVVG